MIDIRIPASTGNLGSGFDVLGLAVQLYRHVEVERLQSLRCRIHYTGIEEEKITASNSLMVRTVRKVLKSRGIKAPGFSLTIRNNIPMRRGLGSSGVSILAGVIAANYLGRLNLTEKEILSIAIQIEGPPDNINSSLVGGLTASLVIEDGTVEFRRCRFPAELRPIFTIPDIHVSTRRARKILPKRYTLKQVIYNLQRVSLFFEAVRTKDYELLSLLFKDRLHQPYRMRLVPGQSEVLNLPAENGLIGTFISGSGSTVCALAVDNFSEIGTMIADIFSSHNVETQTIISKADNSGTKIIER